MSLRCLPFHNGQLFLVGLLSGAGVSEVTIPVITSQVTAEWRTWAALPLADRPGATGPQRWAPCDPYVPPGGLRVLRFAWSDVDWAATGARQGDTGETNQILDRGRRIRRGFPRSV